MLQRERGKKGLEGSTRSITSADYGCFSLYYLEHLKLYLLQGSKCIIKKYSNSVQVYTAKIKVYPPTATPHM